MVEPTLFNGDIEFDIETIPKALQEQCLKLEELDRAGDDISYALLCDNLDYDAKGYFLSGNITEKQWRTIQKRYCGYQFEQVELWEFKKYSELLSFEYFIFL